MTIIAIKNPIYEQPQPQVFVIKLEEKPYILYNILVKMERNTILH
jgi:hypothetical protein